ncbi:hypothetical protein J6590_012835 [Homalodisca vitripennis]|nr:hypothetical protein J6590_012835 [Homalodisca vitripennis]
MCAASHNSIWCGTDGVTRPRCVQYRAEGYGQYSTYQRSWQTFSRSILLEHQSSRLLTRCVSAA